MAGKWKRRLLRLGIVLGASGLVALVALVGVGLLASRDARYTRIEDYASVLESYEGEPAVAHFPPAAAVPSGARFFAWAGALQAPTRIALLVPSSEAEAAIAAAQPVVSGQPRFHEDQGRRVLAELDGGPLDATSAERRLLYVSQDGFTFGAIWADRSRGRLLYFARFD